MGDVLDQVKQVFNAQRLRAVANATATLTRQSLLRLMNESRDVDLECHYPAEVTDDMYWAMFDRFGVAARVVEFWPDESWKTFPEVYDDEDPKTKTDFELAWSELDERKHLLANLFAADVLSGVGDFGLLVIGVGDGGALSEPARNVTVKNGELVRNAISKGNTRLLYIKPVARKYVTILERERNTKSPRYGMPKVYGVTFEDTGAADVGEEARTITQRVHWTRCVHLADGRLGSEVYGVPRMKRVYNQLLDLKKLLGGSAEMFWKGAFFGIGLEPIEGAEFDDSSITEAKDELKQYFNSLQRYIAIEGVKPNVLAPAVADPTAHVESQLKAICATLKVPYRVFIGSEEAQLASAQDRRTWADRVKSRQLKYLTPFVVRRFVSRLIALGVLPEPQTQEKGDERGRFMVDWGDLAPLTPQEVAQVAVTKTDAMSKYASGGASAVCGPHEFLTLILGHTDDEADQMLEGAEDQAEKEEEAQAELEEQVTPAQQAPAGPGNRLPAKQGQTPGNRASTGPQGTRSAPAAGNRPSGKLAKDARPADEVKGAKNADEDSAGPFQVENAEGDDPDGKWITLPGGKHVFIRDGQTLADAMDDKVTVASTPKLKAQVLGKATADERKMLGHVLDAVGDKFPGAQKIMGDSLKVHFGFKEKFGSQNKAADEDGHFNGDTMTAEMYPMKKGYSVDDAEELKMGDKFVGGKSYESAVRHEIGHGFYDRVLDNTQQVTWEKAFKATPKSEWKKVSKYAATSHDEAFAESFAAYTHRGYKAGSLPKVVEDFLATADAKWRGKQ